MITKRRCLIWTHAFSDKWCLYSWIQRLLTCSPWNPTSPASPGSPSIPNSPCLPRRPIVPLFPRSPLKYRSISKKWRAWFRKNLWSRVDGELKHDNFVPSKLTRIKSRTSYNFSICSDEGLRLVKECVHMTSRRPRWRSNQRNGGHGGGVKYSSGDWTLFFCKFLLLFHYANMVSGKMSEHTLYCTARLI